MSRKTVAIELHKFSLLSDKGILLYQQHWHSIWYSRKNLAKKPSLSTSQFFSLSQDKTLVFRDATLISRDATLVYLDESRVLREGGNLLLSGTVFNSLQC